jgi:hypothetical protein
MKRRRLLHGSGLLVAGALGGCSSPASSGGTETDSRSRTDTNTDAESAANPSTPVGTVQRTTAPAVGRSVYVSTVLPNPEGPDVDALDEEYVLVETAGDATLDLSGYTLTYGRRDEYVFPDLVSDVEPGGSVDVHTGDGSGGVDASTPPRYSLYVGSDAPLLANDGMRLTIRDRDGTRVDSVEYWAMDEGVRYVRPET